MSAQKFDFETYVIKTLDGITKQLEGLNAAFMPREEINLRFAEINKTQAETVKTLAEHTKMLTLLKSTDDRQEGSITTSRRFVGYGLSVLGLLMTALFIYVSWKVGTAKL